MIKKKEAGRIPAAQLGDCKPWQLPRVKGGHVVRSPFAEKQKQDAPLAGASAHVASGEVSEEEMEPTPLTVEELEKIRQDARDEGHEQGYREGREEGHQAGLATGRDEGYQAGLSQAQGEIDALKAQLAGLIQALEQPLAEQRGELEQVLVHLATEAARAVVNRELNTRPELFRQAVEAAMDALPPSEQGLTFIVHPDDAPLLKEIQDRERSDWEIYADSDVARGGLRVKGRHSYLDFTRERRFAEVVEQLLEKPAAEEE
ncbi:flagellar assembly protein FliH [Motiliproteus sp. SC1-56]|uniref:flagellar assembly protein FliH n=1 Tax=Motiliproteus sp. SC1-56 TaxID=2799565 RepID=UPI001A8C8DAA|nr:flagellar assembly protein FliH [Motiliproteus sp. SC1-56]